MPKDISLHQKNIIYLGNNGEILLREDKNLETIWANLEQISGLFGRDKSTISRHIKNIFSTDELSPDGVVAKNATTGSDGKTYQIEYYNLDMILSVGYRLNSKQATEFRKWSNSILKNYITQGVVVNQTFLEKNTQTGRFRTLFLSKIKGLKKKK